MKNEKKKSKMFSAPSFPMFLSHPFNIIIITVNEASLALRVKKFPRFSYLFVSFLCDSFFLCFDKTTPMSFDRYCHRLWWMVTLSWQFNFSSVIYTIKFELIPSRKLLKSHTIKLFLLSRTNADQTLFLFNHFSLRSTAIYSTRLQFPEILSRTLPSIDAFVTWKISQALVHDYAK